jgi:hypothetical protein
LKHFNNEQFNLNANNDKVLRNTAVPNKINLREKTVQVSCERINYLPICTKYHKLILLQMIRANFDLKFPLQIDFQEDNLEAKIENLQTVTRKKLIHKYY